MWGWKVSVLIFDILYYLVMEICCCFVIGVMVFFIKVKEYYSGLGFIKVGNIILFIIYYWKISWYVIIINEDELCSLLGIVMNFGVRYCNGFGKVVEWEIIFGFVDGWK